MGLFTLGIFGHAILAINMDNVAIGPKQKPEERSV
jgi:hypothetical protein